MQKVHKSVGTHKLLYKIHYKTDFIFFYLVRKHVVVENTLRFGRYLDGTKNLMNY